MLYRKFQQETREEIPHDVLYCGRLMQYLEARDTITQKATAADQRTTHTLHGPLASFCGHVAPDSHLFLILPSFSNCLF